MSEQTETPEKRGRIKSPVAERPGMADVKDRANALRAKGMTWSEVSSAVGVSIGTLRTWAHRRAGQKHRATLRVKRLQREFAPASEKFPKSENPVPATVPTVPTKQTLNQSIEDLSTLVKSLLARDSLATAERLAHQHAIPQTLDDEHTRESVMEKLAKRSAQVLGWESASQTVQVQVGVLASLPDRPEN